MLFSRALSTLIHYLFLIIYNNCDYGLLPQNHLQNWHLAFPPQELPHQQPVQRHSEATTHLHQNIRH